ncbi:MAG TPA: hypothetical protein VD883_03035 [Candidatus Omnitrophota bacterium]|nr:hypothetical protein [Candidatus Omnitrophota bacterium]
MKLRTYFFFLILGPISNAIWAFWALPDIGEQGTWTETIQWLCTQAILPVLFAAFVSLRAKLILWFILVYSGFIILFGVGIFGWALMGPDTPLSIYVFCAVLFLMGFGLLYQSMKDLNFGKKGRVYDVEDQ